MALSQQQCSTIVVKLSPIIGEEVAAAMANEFANWDYEKLVTKDFLRAELAELQGDLRAEFHADLGGVRAELHSELGGLRAEIADRFRDQTRWIIGLMLTWGTLLVGAVGLVT